MRIRIILLLILNAAILFAEARNTGVISGIVQEKQSVKPVTGVTVFMEGLGRGCPSEQRITGRNGDFQFSELPPGKYRITAFKQGYQKVAYGETKENKIGESIVLVPSNMNARIVIELPLGAGISGHVYDSGGQPAAGCDVTFDPVGVMGSIYFTKTDSTGYYWVSDLPAGVYLVSVRRFSVNGKVTGDTWYYPGTVRKEEAKELELKAGKTTPIDLSFGDESKVAWTGRVLGPKGEPVAGAEIRKIRFLEKTTDVQDGCWTNQAGECSLIHLDSGEYRFFVQSAPAPYAPWFDQNFSSYSKRVKFQESQKPVVTEFRLKKGQTVEGKFYFSDGNYVPDPGMKVYLRHTRDVPGTSISLPALTQAGADTFTIYGIHPELQYQIEIWSNDQRMLFYPIRIILNNADISQMEFVQIPGGDPSKMDVYIGKSATIAATGSPKYPVWDADWTAGPSYPKLIYMHHQFVAIAGQGKFLFRGLPPGKYRIHPQNEQSPFEEVTVEEGETREIRIPN